MRLQGHQQRPTIPIGGSHPYGRITKDLIVRNDVEVVEHLERPQGPP